jgi:hypothetical protein
MLPGLLRSRLLAASITLSIGATACGGGGPNGAEPPAAGCGEVRQERIDPDHLVHLLPGAEEPAYLSDPPTSGPHAPSAAREGVADAPLTRAEQVGQLEAGVVLLQHDGTLAADDLAALEDLAGQPAVLLAPNDELPAPVIATAWTRKLVCTSLGGGGTEALTAFVAEFAGHGPGTDG